MLFISLLAMMFSCQEVELIQPQGCSDADIYATIESVCATRTSMDQNNNVLWSEGDQIIAFMQTTLGSKYQIKEQYVGSTTGGFSKVVEDGGGDDLESGQELDHNVILYPYSTSVWCMKNDSSSPTQSYKLNVVLPATQAYAENTFANGSFPMVAVSSNNQLTFKNVLGGLKLQFKGVDKIRSICLEGIGGEAISGKSTVVGYVNGNAPTITMASTATKSITLDCGDGVQLNESVPTTFIISVPPVTFASGMKITVTDTDGFSRVLTNPSSNTVKRSSLLTFPVITYSQEGVFELPEDALTSYEILAEGGNIEIPVKTNQDYEVIIPEGAGEWITHVETKALREETIVLNVAANTTSEARSAEVLIATTEGVTLQSITVSQEADNTFGNKTYSLGAVVGGAYWERFLIVDNDQYDIVVPSDARSWCSSSISYDANLNHCVYIKVYNNPGEARSTVISVTDTSDNTTYEIAINQEAASDNDEKYLIFENNTSCANNQLDANPGNHQEFQEIFSNIDFDDLVINVPEDAQSWVVASLSRTDVDGKYVLLLSAKLNTGAERNANLEITSRNNSNLILEVRVYQAEGEPVVYSYIDANGNNLGNGVDIDGVVWAPVNVGASVSSEYGSYYTWVEAHGACPDGWRLPTRAEYASLASTSEWTILDENSGRYFYGSSSSNSPVFLPAAGNSTGTIQWGYAGYYHTINQPATSPSYAYVAEFTSSDAGITQIGKDSGKYSIRCVHVSDEELEAQEITIDGLTWMTKNLGAEKISDIGNHYTPVQSSTVCPAGWRLPTIDEYNALALNSISAAVNNVSGYWLSGSNQTSNESTGIFLPLGHYYYNGNDGIEKIDDKTIYLTSTKETYTKGFCMDQSGFSTYDNVYDNVHFMPVRCVKGAQTLPYINASVQSVEVAYEGVESQVIALNSNVGVFSVEVPEDAASWIEASVSGKKLTVKVSENTGYPRSASIKVSYANNPSYYTEIPVNQEGLVEFNENHCIYYRANKTGGWDTGMNNYRATNSYITCGAGGVTVEMKFRLNALASSSQKTYLGASSNLAKDYCDEFSVTQSGLVLSIDVNDSEWYNYSWKWSEIGVEYTDLITLRFSGADQTLTINGKVLSCEGLGYMSWSYIFSSYYRENDEGEWKEYEGVPEGSELYYVKMYDANGALTYFGHAAKLKNSTEYCWYSTKNGTATCQYANDSANQGGYTANF